MEKIPFSKINLLDWGNKIIIKGLVMENQNDDNLIVLLPLEKSKGKTYLIEPSSQQWYDLQDQLDKCNIEGDKGALLRKGQRQIDQKISWNVYRRDKYKCRYCGIDNVPLTVDHIITWETGGASHESNLVTCCKKCNKKRGNTLYENWLKTKYYTEKSAFLTENIRKKNEELVKLLAILPRLAKPRDR